MTTVVKEEKKSKAEIKAELDKLGVKYPKTATLGVLEALLQAEYSQAEMAVNDLVSKKPEEKRQFKGEY